MLHPVRAMGVIPIVAAEHPPPSPVIVEVSPCHVAGHVASAEYVQSVLVLGTAGPPGSTTSHPTHDIQAREPQCKCVQSREHDQPSCTGCKGKEPVPPLITSKSQFLTCLKQWCQIWQ